MKLKNMFKNSARRIGVLGIALIIAFTSAGGNLISYADENNLLVEFKEDLNEDKTVAKITAFVLEADDKIKLNEIDLPNGEKVEEKDFYHEKEVKKNFVEYEVTENKTYEFIFRYTKTVEEKDGTTTETKEEMKSKYVMKSIETPKPEPVKVEEEIIDNKEEIKEEVVEIDETVAESNRFAASDFKVNVTDESGSILVQQGSKGTFLYNTEENSVQNRYDVTVKVASITEENKPGTETKVKSSAKLILDGFQVVGQVYGGKLISGDDYEFEGAVGSEGVIQFTVVPTKVGNGKLGAAYFDATNEAEFNERVLSATINEKEIIEFEHIEFKEPLPSEVKRNDNKLYNYEATKGTTYMAYGTPKSGANQGEQGWYFATFNGEVDTTMILTTDDVMIRFINTSVNGFKEVGEGTQKLPAFYGTPILKDSADTFSGNRYVWSFADKDDSNKIYYRVYGNYDNNEDLYESDKYGNVGYLPKKANKKDDEAVSVKDKLVGKELTDNAAFINSLKVTEIIDGTPDLKSNGESGWDKDDHPGNDSSANNRIVRSFDDIMYKLDYQVNMQSSVYRGFERGKIYLKIELDKDPREALINTDEMAWMKDVKKTYRVNNTIYENLQDARSAAGEKEIITQIVTGYRIKEKPAGEELAIPGGASLSAVISVGSSYNGDKIQPRFVVYADGNNEDPNTLNENGYTEAKKALPEQVLVSAAPKYNVVLNSNKYTGQKGDFDFNSGNPDAVNNDKGIVQGRIYGYSIMVQLYNDNDEIEKGIKGIEIPKDDIKINLESQTRVAKSGGGSQYQDITKKEFKAGDGDPLNYFDKNGKDYTPMPLLWDYKLMTDNSYGDMGRNLEWQGSSYTHSGAGTAVLGNGGGTSGAYKGGEYHGKQNSSTIELTLNKYDFADRMIYGVTYPKHLIGVKNEEIGKNIATFSAGHFQIVQPLVSSDDVTENIEMELNLNVSDVDFTSLSGTKVKNQMNLKDDFARFDLIITTKGTYSKTISYRSEKGEQLSTEFNSGDAFAGKGEKVRLYSRVHQGVSNDTDYNIYAANIFTKFDNNTLEVVSGQDENSILASSSLTIDPNQKIKVLYVGKEGGWKSDSDMQNTREDDPSLYYFDSIDKIPTNLECVGILYEIRTDKRTPIYAEYFGAYSPLLIVKENAEEGHVAQAINDVSIWRIGLFDQTGGNIPSRIDVGNNKIKADALENSDIKSTYKYSKTQYTDNQILAGGHKGSHFAGNSLLIVGAKATITKEIEQKNGKNPKSIFDLGLNQRIVDYKIMPGIETFAQSNMSGKTTTVTITDTLPKGLTYLVGSSFIGGTYVDDIDAQQHGRIEGGLSNEPEITINPNGTTKLQWKIKDVSFGVKLDEIHYSAKIGNQENYEDDVKDGDVLNNIATIHIPEDNRAFTTKNKNTSSSRLTIVKLSDTSLSKWASPSINEIGDDINFNLGYSNSGQNKLNEIKIMDVLPYNGDGRGTKFNGDYRLSNKLKISTVGASNLDVYYSELEVVRNKTAKDYSVTDLQNGKDGWTKATKNNDQFDLSESKEIKSIMIVGSLDKYSTIKVPIALSVKDNKTGDVYSNNLTMTTSSSDTTNLEAPTVQARVIYRAINGVAWNDANQNGKKDSNERLLRGVKANLLQKDSSGNYVPAKNVMGDSVDSVITDRNGFYEFTELAAGDYQVVFEGSPSFNIAAYKPTKQHAVGVPLSQSSDIELNKSDSSGFMESAIIKDINLPEADKITSYVYKKADQNAGMFKEPTYVTRRNISVTKAWDDNNNEAGIRPGDVDVQLYKDGTSMGEDYKVTLNEANSWKHTWENIPYYSNEMSEVVAVYTVREVDPHPDYDVTYGPLTNSEIEITNTYVAPLVDPTKAVSDDDEKLVTKNKLESRNETFLYTIEQEVPTYNKNRVWVNFMFEDVIDKDLDVTKVKVLNGAGSDVTDKFKSTGTGNSLKYEANKDWLKEEGFYGQTYTFEVSVKIKSDVAIASLVTYKNTAKLTLSGDPKVTNEVETTYTPPVEPTDPIKRVSDTDEDLVLHNTLDSRKEDILYTMTQEVPGYHIDKVWKNFVFEDALHANLEFKSIKIENEDGDDVTDNFKGQVKNGVIRYEAKSEWLNSEEFYDHTYTFLVTTNIKESVVIENTLITPNKAEFTLDKTPVLTNEVTTKYTPPKDPTIPTKTVSDDDQVDVVSNTLDSINEGFSYAITQVVPEYHEDKVWEEFKLEDTLNEALDFKSIKVTDKDGDDVTDNFDNKTTGNKVVLEAKKSWIQSKEFYDNTYRIEIQVKINDKVAKDKVVVIDNQATLTLDQDPTPTNKVTTNYIPPLGPDGPRKTVSDKDETNVFHNTLVSRDETITYRISQVVPEYHKDKVWADFIFEDILPDEVEFKSFKVIDEDDNDVTGKFSGGTNAQEVKYSASTDWLKETDFYKHTYTFEITAVVKSDLEIPSRIEFPNTATVTLDSDPKLTNEVTTKYTPPTEPTTPEKTVSDVDQINVNDNTIESRDELITYRINQAVPTYHVDKVWESFNFEDEISGAFDVKNVKVLQDGTKDVTDQFKDSTIGNKISLVAKTDWLESEEFYDHTYTFEIEVKISKDFDIMGEIQIDNEASLTIDGKPTNTNKVTTKYIPPKDPEGPTKTVSDADEFDVTSTTLESRGETLTYKIRQEVPEYHVDKVWAEFIFEDELHEALNFKTMTIVDETGKDVSDKFTSDNSGQKLKYTADTEWIEKEDEFYKHTYSFIITAEIDEDYKIDSELLIDNEADLTLDTTSKTTNKVKSTYIPPTTDLEEPIKVVSDKNEDKVNDNTIESRYEGFTYTISQEVPEYHIDRLWKSFSLSDSMDGALELVSFKVTRINDKGTTDVTNEFVNTGDKHVVVLEGNNAWLKTKDFYSATYEFELSVKLRDDYEIIPTTEEQDAEIYKNKATFDLNGKPKLTNEVTTKYVPPILPQDPTKAVSDEDETLVSDNWLQSRKEEFVYTINQSVPTYHEDKVWENFIFEDSIQPFLKLNGFKVSDENGTDVTNKFKKESTENNLRYVAKDSWIQSEEFYNHTYTFELTVVIKDDHEIKGEIAFDNEGRFTLDNEAKVTNVVTTHFKPHEEPEDPEKNVSDDNEIDVTVNDMDSIKEALVFKVIQDVPAYHKDKVYKNFVFEDTLHEALNLESIEVLDKDGNDVTAKFTNSSNGQKVKLAADTQWLEETEFYSQTYTFVLNTKIKDDFEVPKELIVDNKASLTIDNVPKITNETTTKYVKPDPIKDPNKTVSDDNEIKVLENTLDSKEEKIVYHVNQEVHAYHKDQVWSKFTFEDTLDDSLKVGTIKVYDEDDNDVTDKFTDTSSGQSVNLVADTDWLETKEFYNHTYTFEIEATIKDSVEIKEAVVYLNTADLERHDIPKTTNEVKTNYVPPKDTPDPEKEIETVDGTVSVDGEVVKRDDTIKFNIKQDVPTYHKDNIWESFNFEDEIDAKLDIKSVKVMQDGVDVSDKFEDKTSGQTIKLVADTDWLETEEFYNHTYTFIIEVKLKDGVGDPSKDPDTVEFENQASLTLNNKPTTTNKVKGKYIVPILPDDPTKSVSDRNEENVINNTIESKGETFLYRINQEVPEYHVDKVWESFTLEDTIEDDLSFISFKVVNEEGTDVTTKFMNKSSGQDLKFDADKTWISSKEFYEHTYTFEIKVQIKKGAVVDTEVIYKNTGNVIRDKDPKLTNEVTTKYVPPVNPNEPEKTVSDEDEFDGYSNILTSRNENYLYKITQSVPKYHEDKVWANFTFEDDLQSDIELISIKVVDDKDKDVTDRFVDKTKGNKVRLEADTEWLKEQSFYDHTYTFELGVKIKDKVKIPTTIEIYNTAEFMLDTQAKTTNEVVTVYTPPVLPLAPTKDVSDKDEFNVDFNTLDSRDETFTYRIYQSVPTYHVDKVWKNFELKDTIDKRLTVVGYKVLDENGDDVSDKFSDNSSENKLNYVADTNWISKEAFYGQRYTFEVEVRITKGLEAAQDSLNPTQLIFKNIATTVLDGEDKKTNEVTTVYTPAKLPEEPTKTVSDKDETDTTGNSLSSRDEVITYKINQDVPAYHKDKVWQNFELEDTLHVGLKVVSVKVLQDGTTDVSDKFTDGTQGNEVKISADDEWLKTKEFYNHKYTFVIEAKFRDDFALPELDPSEIGLENTGKVTVDNNPKLTNKVITKYTPPKLPDTPTKNVSDLDEKEVLENTLATYNETFTYKVVQEVPTYHVDKIWKEFTFTDKIDDRLEILSVTIRNEKNENVTSEFKKVDADENEIVYEAKESFLNSEEFYGHTYTYVVEVKSKDTSIPKEKQIYENVAEFVLDKSPAKTNKVKTTYIPPTDTKDPKKTVSDANNIDVTVNNLVSSKENIVYNITQEVPTYHKDNIWKNFVFEDTISDMLNVLSVKVFDENGKDVTKLFSDTSNKNNIYVEAKANTLTSESFYGHTYRFEITTKIRIDIVIDKELIVDNKANLTINNKPKVTNKVTTKYIPPVEPENPTKVVTDKDESGISNTIDTRDEVFKYEIKQAVPGYHVDKVWKDFDFEDTIAKELELVSFKVVNEDGDDVTGEFKNASKGNTVAYKAKSSWLKTKEFYDHTYTFELSVKVREDAKIEGTLIMENTAEFTLDGKGKVTNKVTTTYIPPIDPKDPVKTVSDDDETNVTENEINSKKENIIYRITQDVPAYHVDKVWQDFILEDQINDLLTIKDIKVIDEKGEDVTSNFKDETKGNAVKLVANSKWISSKDFYSHTYTFEITTVIKDGAVIEGSIKVDNQASVIVDNNPKLTNKVVTKYIPNNEKTPDPTKTVKDSDEMEGTSNTLSTKSETFTYTLRQSVPSYHVDTKWSQFVMKDEIDERLDVKSVVIKDETGKDVTDRFTNSSSDNKLDYAAKKDFLEDKNFYSHTYVFEIDVKIKDSVNVDGDMLVENIAVFLRGDNKPKETNKVTTVFKNPKTDINIEVNKILDGRQLAQGEFEFILSTDEGTVLQTKSNAANGSVVFDAIEYTKEGTYTYVVHESNTGKKDIEYDEENVEVSVEVTKDEESNTLVAKASYEKGKKEGNTFVNKVLQPKIRVNTGVSIPKSQLFGILAVASLGGAVAVIATYLSRRKKESDEE